MTIALGESVAKHINIISTWGKRKKSHKIHKFNKASSHASNTTHEYLVPDNEIVTSLEYKNR